MATDPRPDSAGLPNTRELDASATSGWVTRNTTTRSSTVDRPSVNAKPFTCPTARMYSTAEARKLTASADRIVRRARTQPRGTAERNVRPSRISSLMRSKKMTNESAVMPIATMKPATPAMSSVKPIHRPSSTSTANTITPDRTSDRMVITPRTR